MVKEIYDIFAEDEYEGRLIVEGFYEVVKFWGYVLRPKGCVDMLEQMAEICFEGPRKLQVCDDDGAVALDYIKVYETDYRFDRE